MRAYTIKYDYFHYIFQTAGPFATKLGLILQYYKPYCPAEKMDYCVQGQGHSEDLCNQNKTIFYYIFQTAGPFATKLGVVVQHYKPECPAEKMDYCVQGQGHSEG